MTTRDPSAGASAATPDSGHPGPAVKRSGSRGLTCLVVVVVAVVLAPTIVWYAASRGLWWEVRPTPMQVSNFTGVDLVIIHRDDNGNETTLTDYEGRSRIRAFVPPNIHGGLSLEPTDAQCRRGSLIARTVDGNEEIDRLAVFSGCPLQWIIGTPPSPMPTLRGRASPSTSAATP
jgi:hypothetical protein